MVARILESFGRSVINSGRERCLMCEIIAMVLKKHTQKKKKKTKNQKQKYGCAWP